MTTLYERGRLTGIQGMESVLTLKPENMGPRVKKSVIRMLDEAHITGGWYSRARRITELLVEQFGLNVIQTTWRTLTIHAQPTEDTRDQLIELVRADITAFLLENPEFHRSWYTDQANKTIAELEDGTAKKVEFRCEDFAKKAVKVFNGELPESYKQEAKQIIELLTNNTPIHVTTIRS